jgi:hypothetical protein
MRTYDYIPQDKTIDGTVIPTPFKGSVKIKVPKYTDRLRLMKECNFKVRADGQIDPNTDMIDQAIKMVEVAKKHVLEVDLVRDEDKERFTDFESLEYDSDGSEVINEIANFVMSGGRLGKH